MLHPMKKMLMVVAALAALALGGTSLASATSTTTTPTTPTTPSPSGAPAFRGPAHGTAAHENAEKAVTGDAAAKAQAAAVKSVGSGTAGAVTTDMTGTGFETTVTKADGTKVEVHLDSSYNVMHGPGHHGGPPPAGYAG
jgi:outer membrane lipoprotein SlyB